MVEEAILTGEIDPVNKSTDIIESEGLDLRNTDLIWCFPGTLVTAGSAKAVVVVNGRPYRNR